MDRTFEAAEDRAPLSPHRDLSGLAVHDADDLLAGHVFGVLSETEIGVIRFLDVELDGEGRHVLVPIGHARLEQPLGLPRLRLRAARLHDLRNIPSYHAGSAWNDQAVARELAGLYGRFFRGDRYYAHPAYDHRGLYAGPHPIILENGQEPAATRVSVAGGDYRSAEGHADPRGWAVLDAEDNEAGCTADLLVDPKTDQVRYAVIRLQDGSRRLLPIGYLQLDRDEHRLLLPGLTATELHALADFAGAVPTRSEEELLLDQIERALDARNPFLRVEFSDRQVMTEE